MSAKKPMVFKSTDSLLNQAGTSETNNKKGKPDENPVMTQISIFLEKSVCK